MERWKKKIISLGDYNVIKSSVESLNCILCRTDIDYVGTRLHAGIRAFNMGKCFLIIAVDNRARQMGENKGLPVIERFDSREALVNATHSTIRYEIHLPWDNIEQWKRQWD